MTFSVIIPTHNRAGFVELAVQSVLNQTFQDFELIVIDDGSEDATGDRLSRFSDRIRYVRQNRQERSAARNRGIELASGDYLAFLDSDDLWHREKLERQVDNLICNPEAGLLYSSFERIDPRGERIPWPVGRKPRGRSGWIYEKILLSECMVHISTAVIRRSLLKPGEGFNAELTVAEDLDFFLNIARRSKAHFDPAVLVSYRIHSGQSIQRTGAIDLEQAEARVIEKRLSDQTLPANLRRRCSSVRQLRLAAWYAREHRGEIARRKLLAGFRQRPLVALDWRWWGTWVLALEPRILRLRAVARYFAGDGVRMQLPEQS